MAKQILSILVILTLINFGNAQFHTLKIPKPSNLVFETQRLGVTDITIRYSSPSVRERDIWADIVPLNGNPVPWRAGANLNTTIEFSTNVTINGEELKAGKYGFHIIYRENGSCSLLFAHANNLWGSYYLDIDKDITLKVESQSKVEGFSEKLDYEFMNWNEDAVDIVLEWGNRQIPFTVSVDLNKTVVESFRAELRGENTNRWQAWNDAASWCLNRNINLEEALQWVDRSINGGYGGFAANKNLDNLTTKFFLLQRLNRKKEAENMINDLEELDYGDWNAYDFSRGLIELGSYKLAKDFLKKATKKYPERWFLVLGDALASYHLGNKKEAVGLMKKNLQLIPERHIERTKIVIQEMKAGTYKMPSQ